MVRLQALGRIFRRDPRGVVEALFLAVLAATLPFGSLLLLARWSRLQALGRALRTAVAG